MAEHVCGVGERVPDGVPGVDLEGGGGCDTEEQIKLLNTHESCNYVGKAVCNKLTQLLEKMQLYPGNPANVLQFQPM